MLPMGDLVFGQRMMSRLKLLEKAQYWTQNEISVRQLEDLQSLLRIAYKEVPFYRDLMDQSGGKGSQTIKVLSDLSRIPIVTKDMMRAGYPHDTTRSTGQRTYEASTSGSTGKNFFVKEDAYTAGWYRASFLLSLEWAGWHIGESHLQTGMTLNRSVDRRLKDWLLGCHYFSAYHLDDPHLDTILDEIERFDLKFIWGYPGSLYFLARRAKELGWNKPLKAAVTWGDMLFPHYRKMIQEAFITQVFDTYGCGEGFQIAAQCEYGNYHLHALDVVVEFLDDEGYPVQAGKIGNIVITRLHPGPMPLIRYVVGDSGAPSSEKDCPCGRRLPLMQSIQGRNADVITTPSGNRLIVHFFTGIMELFPEVNSFQVIQADPCQIVVKILPVGDLGSSFSERIIKALKEKGAEDLDIKIEYVNEMPFPLTGKHRFVINKLKNDKNDF